MSDHARALRASGHDRPTLPENLDAARPDLVMVGNVIRSGEPGGGGRAGAGLCRTLLPGGPGRAVHRAAPRGGGGGHPRQDHHLGDAGGAASPRRQGPLVPGGRGHAQLPDQLPRGAWAAFRGRGRRVRHGLLRQGSQVPPLPAAHGDLHLAGAGPRRHLPRPGPLPLVFERFVELLPKDGFLAVVRGYPERGGVARAAPLPGRDLRPWRPGASGRRGTRAPAGRRPLRPVASGANALAEVHLAAGGPHNVENALGVAAAATALGLTPDWRSRAAWAPFTG